MTARRMMVFAAAVAAALAAQACAPQRSAAVGVDPYDLQEACGRFPFAQVIPLDGGDAWGLIYADVYGKIYLKRATAEGWKREWEITNLGAKVRRFFIVDVEPNGVLDLVVATMSGRILIYRLDDYSNIWENIEDDFSSIEAIDVVNIDSDPQMEFVFIADGTLYIVDSSDKRRQWISQQKFTATELIVANVDKDEQLEIILNTGIVIDSKFYQVDLAWDKPFGERLAVFDINSDGINEVIGEFPDYSLRIFDVYAQREVW